MKKIKKITVLILALIFCSCLITEKTAFVAPTTESLAYAGEDLIKFIAGSLASEVSLNSPLALLESEQINVLATTTSELQKQILNNFKNMLKKHYKIKEKEGSWEIILEFVEDNENLQTILIFRNKTEKKQEIKRKFSIK